VINVNGPHMSTGISVKGYWKRYCFAVGERFIAAVLVVMLSPVLLAVWITILLLSARPPLIAHKRVGQNGTAFWVFKFRTMWAYRARFRPRNAVSVEHIAVEYVDDQLGPSRKNPQDPRVSSRFARFCRRHSLDELPQLANVLFGEMSLVGPRPVTEAEIAQIYGSTAEEVLSVKPGLSGLWQVSGRNRLSIAERCRLDLECVRQRSTSMYIRVLMRTLPELFMGENGW
jgi:exopolysaccharide production protein ExoY